MRLLRVSGHLSARVVRKGVLRASRSPVRRIGNDTWLTRFFAAANSTPIEGGRSGGAERVDEAVQLRVPEEPC